MAAKSNWVKIIITAGVIVLVSVICYEIYGSFFDPVVTETAIESTLPQTVSTKLFVVRNEQLVERETTGTVVPLIDDGEMAAKGDTVAVVCPNAEDAVAFTRIRELKKDIARLEQLNTQQNVNSMDIEKMNNEIDLAFTDMLNVVSSGKYEDFDTSSVIFRDKLTNHQIAIGGSIDFSKKIEALQSELNSLESRNLAIQNLIAKKSGYYINSADGYENTFSYEHITDVTASQVEKAIQSAPGVISSNVIGKLDCDYDWYLLSSLKSGVAAQLKIGQTVKIEIGVSSDITISAKVFSIKSSQGGNSAVVFVCNLMNEQLSELRITDAHIILEEYTGLKVNKSAIRIQNGVTGAYILRGNIISFRRLNIIYSQADYVIADDESSNSNNKKQIAHVKLYDEVVIKGKNIHEGKIIN